LKEDAEAWLASAGLKIVTERLDEPKTLAATRIERWQHQLLGGDAVALREIIEAVRATDVTVARFLTLITSSIEERRRREAHPQLPLRPVPVGGLERKKAHG
jgi:hypothetical protein